MLLPKRNKVFYLGRRLVQNFLDFQLKSRLKTQQICGPEEVYFKSYLIDALLYIVQSGPFHRYRSGDQQAATETAGQESPAGPPGGGGVGRGGSNRASKGELDLKAQIEKQKELQEQVSSQAKARTSSAPTSPMKEGGKRASFFGKVSQNSQSRDVPRLFLFKSF